MRRQNAQTFELESRTLSPGLRIALTVAWIGATFALCAAAYVWLTRGQFPWVTVVAAMATIDLSIRIYRGQLSPLRHLDHDPLS